MEKRGVMCYKWERKELYTSKVLLLVFFNLVFNRFQCMNNLFLVYYLGAIFLIFSSEFDHNA